MTGPISIESILDRWPAEHVGCALVGPDETIGHWGDINRAFELASVTKAIVSLGCWVALEEGSLGLDDAVGPPGCTVAHLMAHASGLPFEGTAPTAAAGARRIYSNTGFEVLAAHLETAVGFSWQEYMIAAVCEPLGLASTHFGPSAARSATSTVHDLARLCRELLRPTLISATTLAEATSNQFGDIAGVVPGFGRHDPCPWGLGVEIRGAKLPHWTGRRCSARTFGHFGGAGTFVWIDPDRNLAAVGLGNTAFGPWASDLWPALSDALISITLNSDNRISG